MQDWNNRRQFAPPSDFHADGVNEFFISQVMDSICQFGFTGPNAATYVFFFYKYFSLPAQAAIESTRANDILKQAPFLIPFTSRVKIFTVSCLPIF